MLDIFGFSCKLDIINYSVINMITMIIITTDKENAKNNHNLFQ